MESLYGALDQWRDRALKATSGFVRNRLFIILNGPYDAAKLTVLQTVKSKIPSHLTGPAFLLLKQFHRSADDLFARNFRSSMFVRQRCRLQTTNLLPFTRDKSIRRVDVKSASRETGAQLVLEYETNPAIPKIDKAQIKIEPFPRHVVSEKDIEERIHNLQLQQAFLHSDNCPY